MTSAQPALFFLAMRHALKIAFLILAALVLVAASLHWNAAADNGGEDFVIPLEREAEPEAGVVVEPYSPGEPVAPESPRLDGAEGPRMLEEPLELDASTPEEPEGPLTFGFDGEKTRDPLTGKELESKPDLGRAAEKAGSLDLKGAMDGVNGKAEVKVKLFEF